MKANNGSGNIESRDEWETPQWLFDELHKQYKFDYDCCAKYSNKKTNEFSTNLKKIPDYWFEDMKCCWMNPPFSKALEMFKRFFKVVKKGVAIYRCDNFETKIWQEIIFPNASWVFIPNKRIAYEGMKGTGSRFPSALIGFNVPEIESLVGITLTPSLRSGHLIGIKRCFPVKENMGNFAKFPLNSDIKLNSGGCLVGR